jgi:hypothetical protein
MSKPVLWVLSLQFLLLAAQKAKSAKFGHEYLKNKDGAIFKKRWRTLSSARTIYSRFQNFSTIVPSYSKEYSKWVHVRVRMKLSEYCHFGNFLWVNETLPKRLFAFIECPAGVLWDKKMSNSQTCAFSLFSWDKVECDNTRSPYGFFYKDNIFSQ